MVAGSALLPTPGLGKFSSAFSFSWHGAIFALQCSLITFRLVWWCRSVLELHA